MVAYKYNTDLNQLIAVTGFTAPNGISYNDDGSLRGINYANGAAAVYNYDANRRLDDMKVTVGGQELLNLDYTYDEVGNIKTVNDGGKLKTYEYDKNNQLTKAVTPGTFLETNPTPGTAALKTNDVIGNGVFEFAPVTSGLMGLDYHASSIGIDFGSVAPGVKVIELVPDQNHTNHRINENTIALYVSGNNLNYTLIPRTDWEYQKNDEGIITLTLKEKLETRYLKLHVKYDERGRDFKPVNKATFLNEIAQMLRVYQEAEARAEEYQYDAAGNRKLLKVSLVQTAEFASQYYTNSDRLKTDGKYAFVYDNAGNMVKKGNVYTINVDTVNFTTSGEGVEYWEYKYDLLSRLIKVTKNGNIVSEYAYDPEGLRVVKRAKGETTHYIFQGTEPIFEKKLIAGKSKSYVYALGKYLTRVDGVIGDPEAKKYFYHTDHVGSIRVITDQTGKVVFNADYLAFGTQFGNDGDFEELHGFTGKEYDPDIGLYYFNARWYDPDLGRFISEDPITNPNLYIYGNNNPLSYIDPDGKNPFLVAVLISAIIGGIDAYCNGGDFLTGAFVGAVSGAVSYGFGEMFGASSIFSRALTAGMTGGVMSAAMGGDFGDGFRTGFVSGGVSAYLGGKTNFTGDRFLDGVKRWFNGAFGQFVGTGEYNFSAGDALSLAVGNEAPEPNVTSVFGYLRALYHILIGHLFDNGDGWINPVDGETYISSDPGPRTDVPVGATMWHNGSDHAPVPPGTKYDVVSMGKNGTVIEVHDTVTNSSGKYIKVQYANGIVISYCHLDQIHVQQNQAVSQGQAIGKMGNTSTIQNMAVHLHITARKDGLLINPNKLINNGKINYLNPPNPIPIKQ